MKEIPPTTTDFAINTPLGLLRYLTMRNEHGVWFVRCDNEKWHPLPKWMWGHCNRATEGMDR